MPGTRQLEIIAEPGELQIRKNCRFGKRISGTMQIREMNIRNNADFENMMRGNCRQQI